MQKEMLINVSQGEECRIALVEDGRLEELYVERTSSTSHVGNIYKGRVTNVEPSIQAAFIDFGLNRNGFLHISDLMPSYFGGKAGEMQETVGRKMARRDRPPIQRCLRRGDEIIVQIIKEGIGTKGPTLTTYLSVPGRILVMMPGMGKMGVSRKIEDDVERRRLRQILDSLKPPKDVGFIIRTAGVGKTKTEIQRDLTYLTRLWTIFVKKRDSGPGPTELYTEGDLVTRTVRDVFTSDIERIVVDDKEVAKRVKEVIKLANPRTKNKVDFYEDPVPLFHKYGIELEIEQMYSRHVPLPSGGSLVIDSTEAIVAIDVNSGKFREHADAETTAFKTDMEAADEIPRQLRLRDLGGVIICDFIDLRYERHRRELEGRLHANFQKDRAKTKVLRMSQFGIIELTRQRMRPSLKRSIYFDCPSCKGAGLVKTPESMSLDVMRRVAIAVNDARVARVELIVSSDVNFYLQNKKRMQIGRLEEQFGKRVIIRSEANIGLDEVRLELFDARDGMVYLQELGMSPPASPQQLQQQGGRFDSRRGGRRDERGKRGQLPQGPPQGRGHRDGPQLPPPRARPQDEDQYDMDNVEEEVDRRESEMEEDQDQGAATTLPVLADRGEPESEVLEIPSAIPSADGGQPEFDENDGGPRRHRRRGRRGRGRGRNRDGTPPRDSADMVQPQEQSIGGYVEEFDVDPGDVSDSARDSESEEDVEAPGEVAPSQPPPENRGGGRRPRGGHRVPPPKSPIDHRDEAGPGVEEESSGESDESPDEVNGNLAEPAMPDQEQTGRRRRRRGGRRRRGRGKGNAQAGVGEFEGPVQGNHALPPPPPVRRAAEARSVNPTGSADRHLVNDEPIEPLPLPRPRSYRDLDSIPDDFD